MKNSQLINDLVSLGAANEVIMWAQELPPGKQDIAEKYIRAIYERLGWVPSAVNEWGLWYFFEDGNRKDSLVIGANGRYSIYSTDSIADSAEDMLWLSDTMQKWGLSFGGDGIDHARVF